MRIRSWCSALAFAGLIGGVCAPNQAAETLPRKELASFGILRAPTFEAAKNQAQDWLKTTGKFDQTAFDAIWNETERPLLDLVSDTLILGTPAVKAVLDEARDEKAPAPTKVPDLIKDTKLPTFFRANLAVAYAKALSSRKVYEESLEALANVKPEHVVDPAAYFFSKAVAEHGMLIKSDATRSIGRLLDEVPDAPERYKMVAALMFIEMQDWKNKDLADIGRKMNNIERRLELARGGPQTRKLQKEVVLNLDEIIKKLENQQKGSGSGSGQGNGGQCPDGGQQQPGQGAGAPTSPQQDSYGGQNAGEGKVDPKRLKETIEAWGKLPEKERAKAMTEMMRNMPPAYRQMIEDFYRKGAGQNLP
jgi:hypothetical protein